VQTADDERSHRESQTCSDPEEAQITGEDMHLYHRRPIAACPAKSIGLLEVSEGNSQCSEQ